MRFLALLLVMLSAASSGGADTIFASRTIRAQTILTAQDLVLKKVEVPGAFTLADQIIGLETRVALYAGRPIRPGDVGPPAVVDRNQVVPLIYNANGLLIATEGRSLSRAGAGEYVRVMNLSSRNTVMGLVMPDGRVMVSR